MNHHPILKQARSAFALAVLFLFAAVLQPAGTFAQGSETGLVRTTDLTRIQQLSQVTVSPDGTHAAYVVRSVEHESGQDYRYVNQLWMVRIDETGHEPVQLTRHPAGASQPAWHPDNRRIAFTRAIDGRSQIYVLDLRGGEAVPYTTAENGASNPAWSPNGSLLLFSSTYSHSSLLQKESFAEGPAWPVEKPGIAPLPLGHGISPDPDGSIEQIRAWLDQNERENSPAVLNRLDFQGERALSPERSYTHWFVMADAPRAEARPLTLHTGYHSFSGAAWMWDSQNIVLAGNLQTDAHPDRVADSHLYTMNISDTRLVRLAGTPGFSYSNPLPSPDGRLVAFRVFDNSERGYNQAYIGVHDLRSNSNRYIGQDIDRNLGNMAWSRDSNNIYATAAQNGGFPLFLINARTGIGERLTSEETGIRAFDLSRGLLVYVETSWQNPFELYRADTSARNAMRLSDHNHSWLAERQLSEPVKHTYTTPDGLEIEYWVMKPANYQSGQKFPTLLQIHGGPSAMWGTGEASMWHEFQLFAAHGFGIVFSNPRGSGGYGFDFQRANHRDWGNGPKRDVLGALDDAVRKYSWIDTDQLVLTGGSYGGYLVAYVVAKDHRFKAAAAQRGVYELSTFFGEGNAWRLVPDRFGGFPWQPEVYRVLRHDSPFTYVHQIRTPLLILHGDVDLRTGVSQSEMMYKALKVLEREVEYIRYPGGDHELSRSGNVHHRKDRLLRMIEFFSRYTDAG